jgi:hypothetical protein
MAYENELRSLLEFITQHPGQNVTGLKKIINEQRENDNGYGTFKDCIKWRLRYMELAGDARQENGKWFAVMPNGQAKGPGGILPGPA